MLYQQGTQRIEVIVRKEGTGFAGANETSADEVGGKQATWRTAIFGSENPKRIKRVIKTNATHAYAVSKQVALLAIGHYVGGIGYRNGDQALQETVARNIERVKDYSNIASSVIMGTVYGSWGGPIGAVLGATLAGISTGVSTWVKYAGRERDYDYKMFKEQNAIEYNRARAGINLTNGRLR